MTLGKRVTLWDLPGRKRCGSVKPFAHESEIDLSPRGDRCVVKNTLGAVAVVDLETMFVRLSIPGDPYGEGSEVIYTPDGGFFVDGSWRGDLLVRDAETGVTVLHERGTSIRALAASQDRMTWAYDDADGVCIRQWPFDQNAAHLYSSTEDARIALGGLAFCGPNRPAVSTVGELQIWDLTNGEVEVVAR